MLASRSRSRSVPRTEASRRDEARPGGCEPGRIRSFAAALDQPDERHVESLCEAADDNHARALHKSLFDLPNEIAGCADRFGEHGRGDDRHQARAAEAATNFGLANNLGRHPDRLSLVVSLRNKYSCSRRCSVYLEAMSASFLLRHRGHMDPPDLAARLKWIVDARSDANGKPFTMSSLSEAAGLARSHVAGVVKAGPEASINMGTAIAIARVGQVKAEWLLTGLGPHEPFEEITASDLRTKTSLLQMIAPSEREGVEVVEVTTDADAVAAAGRRLARASVHAERPLPAPVNFLAFKEIANSEGADPAVLAAIQKDPGPGPGPGLEPDIDYWADQYVAMARKKMRFKQRLIELEGERKRMVSAAHAASEASETETKDETNETNETNGDAPTKAS